MDELTSQVAIVTGAASGIGKAVAEVLAEEGISGLTLADINADGLEVVGDSVRGKTSTEVLVSATDVSREDEVNRMVASTIERFERIDILVNVAGIAPTTTWADTTLDNWNHVINTNLNSAFICFKAVLSHMQARKYGRVVNISSAGAVLGSVCAHPAYGASKAGMIAMTKSAAKAHAKDGILVNAIAPGSIDTPMTDSFGECQKQEFKEAAPLKRQGTAREIADAVFYLVSGRSTYVTGATLHVNGGSLLV